MTMLVTLEQAKAHLRVTDDDSNDEIGLKATLASEIVLNYVTHADKDEWTDSSVPGSVQASVFLVLTDLWDHRGGGDDEEVFLSSAVKSLLRRYRDPPLA
jgi:hypothetical protein